VPLDALSTFKEGGASETLGGGKAVGNRKRTSGVVEHTVERGTKPRKRSQNLGALQRGIETGRVVENKGGGGARYSPKKGAAWWEKKSHRFYQRTSERKAVARRAVSMEDEVSPEGTRVGEAAILSQTHISA